MERIEFDTIFADVLKTQNENSKIFLETIDKTIYQLTSNDTYDEANPCITYKYEYDYQKPFVKIITKNKYIYIPISIITSLTLILDLHE